jgi:hypothetical protein
MVRPGICVTATFGRNGRVYEFLIAPEHHDYDVVQLEVAVDDSSIVRGGQPGAQILRAISTALSAGRRPIQRSAVASIPTPPSGRAARRWTGVRSAPLPAVANDLRQDAQRSLRGPIRFSALGGSNVTVTNQ